MSIGSAFNDARSQAVAPVLPKDNENDQENKFSQLGPDLKHKVRRDARL
jgi:hypothetical protein